MLVSFEGQPFYDNFKTGIGWYTYNIIKKIIETDFQNSFEVNIFDLLNKRKSSEGIPNLFNNPQNLSIKKCQFMHHGVYIRNLNTLGLIPYNLFFNSKADIYHFFNFIIPPRIKGKVVNTVYDMVYIRYPETMSKPTYNIHKKNLKRSCEDADVILTISENTKNEITEFMEISPDKIEIAYPAVDGDIFYPNKDFKLVKEKYSINNEYILYFGTIEPRKNINSIIKAFKILSEKNNDISLVLAGRKGWMYEEVFLLVRELGLEEKVIFTGYVAEEDAAALYSCALAFVFPSLYEGFGIPPLEAMACGTPVIVSNKSSLPEVVGDAGILVNALDIENIAYEMDRLIYDDSLRREMSEKGLVQARKFSWEDSAKKVMDIYKAL